jgi:hypothetical protein
MFPVENYLEIEIPNVEVKDDQTLIVGVVLGVA